MFFHNFKYGFLTCIRNRQELFWMLCFPILLSTLFQIAFGNITSKTESFEAIPVAVIAQEGTMTDSFLMVMEEMGENADEPFFLVTETEKEEAQELLLSNEVVGIFTTGDKLQLTLSADNQEAALQQSILESFLQQYLTRVTVTSDTAIAHPEKLEAVISALTEDFSPNKEFSYTDGNLDMYVQYFYNIIAMICMFSSISSMATVIGNQANLSPMGARSSLSPTHRLSATLSQLLSCTLVQLICVIVALFYMILILKVNFGRQIPQILLASFSGILAGASMGYLVGSIGHMRESAKTAILMCVSMLCSFCSGLMMDNMRMIIDKFCPILNKINPAALVTDCLYSLNIYDTYERFFTNIVTLLAMSAVMTAGGILLTRRSRYVSL